MNNSNPDIASLVKERISTHAHALTRRYLTFANKETNMVYLHD